MGGAGDFNRPLNKGYYQIDPSQGLREETGGCAVLEYISQRLGAKQKVSE
jgi:hypothetical protein